jgi:hypothetical protein
MAARREPSGPTPQQPFPLPLENAPSPGATRLRPYIELFLIGFTILFFELACIRWFASSVIFLTFFTNIVLLACFLKNNSSKIFLTSKGCRWGYWRPARRAELIRTVVPLWAMSVILWRADYVLDPFLSEFC